MSTKGIKRLFFGERMPDKDDPQYKERYEKEVETGMKFARWTRIDRVTAHVQRFAERHRNAFLVMVFGFVALSFGYNIYRLTCVYNHRSGTRSVIELQDSVLKEKRRGHMTNHSNTYDNEHITRHQNQD